MKNIFFFEKHPPFGKQLIAGAAMIAGYDGNFTFNKIGSEYTSVRNIINCIFKKPVLNAFLLECSNILASFCSSSFWKLLSSIYL